MQNSFACITIIALLCTIVHLTLRAHKYSPEKRVIKDSQKERAIKNGWQKILQSYKYKRI